MKLFKNFNKRLRRVKTMLKNEKRGFSDLTVYSSIKQIQAEYDENTPLEKILLGMDNFSVLNIDILGAEFNQIPSENPGKLTLIRYKDFNYFPNDYYLRYFLIRN